MPSLNELFKHFRGQPVEVITEGLKVVGIVCESDECSVTLIDRMSRLVHVENRQIEAVVEPQMCVRRVFEDDLGCQDCDIDDRKHRHGHDRERRHGRHQHDEREHEHEREED